MFNVKYFTEPIMYTQSQVNLMNEFRELWTQHVYWTRMFIESTANDLGDLEYVANRLLRNPKDFSDVLKKYYGIEKANKFERLLTDHLTIAAQLVNEAKAGNTAAVAETRKEWYKNADDIAEFLAEINPNWNQSEWRRMLHEHLKLTENEAVQILTNDYVNSINTFDEIEDQSLMMADVMSKGIIKQFRL